MRTKTKIQQMRDLLSRLNDSVSAQISRLGPDHADDRILVFNSNAKFISALDWVLGKATIRVTYRAGAVTASVITETPRAQPQSQAEELRGALTDLVEATNYGTENWDDRVLPALDRADKALAIPTPPTPS